VERVRAFLEAKAPGSVTQYLLPASLPLMLDDPAEFLPPELGEGDVIIAIHLHPDLLLEIPHAVKGKGAAALIAPIEHPDWIRPGLQRQVTQACEQAGLECAFPKPFCSLEPVTPVISRFCESYRVGRPQLRLAWENGIITAAEVVRGSPCGCTEYLASQLVGKGGDEDLVRVASTAHHAYPCLAAMAPDPELGGETIMHRSVDLVRAAVRAELAERRP